MSTRKLIKGDRYRAGLWKLEDSCYEGHVRMPNAKFMIRTYRCTQGEAAASSIRGWRRKASTSLRMGPGKPAKAASTTVWGLRGAR